MTLGEEELVVCYSVVRLRANEATVRALLWFRRGNDRRAAHANHASLRDGVGALAGSRNAQVDRSGVRSPSKTFGDLRSCPVQLGPVRFGSVPARFGSGTVRLGSCPVWFVQVHFSSGFSEI